MAVGMSRRESDYPSSSSLSMSDVDAPLRWTLQVHPLSSPLLVALTREARPPRLPAPHERIQPHKIWPQRCPLAPPRPRSPIPPGCPVSYTPLSLHLPEAVRALRDCQQKYADQVLWWPCSAATAASPLIPAAKQRAALAAGESISHPELRRELSNALSESIPTQPRTDTSIKTSESHPIKSVRPPPAHASLTHLQYFTNHTSRVTHCNLIASYAVQKAVSCLV